MSPVIFYIFNSIGFLLTIAAIIVVYRTAVKMSGIARKGLMSFLKGFVLIGLSFLWTLFFGHLVMPSSAINIQAIVLSLGMALLIYSANKLFEIYERTK